uniref:Homeobox domain-containing protein n=1 Tax=Lotharella globosa TaxID=91324 RepID=A0A7S3Z5P9_9EUKA
MPAYSLRPRRKVGNASGSVPSMDSVQSFLGSLLDNFEQAQMEHEEKTVASMIFSMESSASQTSLSSLEEEYCDDEPSDSKQQVVPQRRKLPRRAREILAEWFEKNIVSPYPSDEQRDMLVQSTGLSAKQIHHWFTNRRKRDHKWRAKYLRRGRGRRPKNANKIAIERAMRMETRGRRGSLKRKTREILRAALDENDEIPL